VIYLTVAYGSLPWLALALAGSFGLYGLVKKTAPLGPLYGLTIETGVLFLPCLLFLVWVEWKGSGSFGHLGLRTDLLLIGAGVVTTVPLLLFASAARSIPLSLIGLLQYIAPTMQFLLGVLLYHEPFTPERAVGFAVIWLALVIFWLEGWLARRRAPDLPVVSEAGD
jgi:chloramphenicol-sensitive protein RarD